MRALGRAECGMISLRDSRDQTVNQCPSQSPEKSSKILVCLLPKSVLGWDMYVSNLSVHTQTYHFLEQVLETSWTLLSSSVKRGYASNSFKWLLGRLDEIVHYWICFWLIVKNKKQQCMQVLRTRTDQWLVLFKRCDLSGLSTDGYFFWFFFSCCKRHIEELSRSVLFQMVVAGYMAVEHLKYGKPKQDVL